MHFTLALMVFTQYVETHTCRSPVAAHERVCYLSTFATKIHLPLNRAYRSVSKTETAVLSLCGKELSLAGFDDLAREAYLKMDDFANVLSLYVKNQVSLKA